MTQNLQNKRVVVTGVTGNVGWGVAKALLEYGAQVCAIARSAASVSSIEESLGSSKNLSIEIADLSRQDAVAELRNRVLAGGPIDHVVAAIGAWWQKGKTVDQQLAEYAAVRSALLDAHVYCAMAFLPSMQHRAGTSYTIITGLGAHKEIPGTGLLVIAASGAVALSRVLRSEHADDAVRVNEVLITTRIEREKRAGVIEAPVFGQEIAGLLSGTAKSMVLRYAGDKLLPT